MVHQINLEKLRKPKYYPKYKTAAAKLWQNKLHTWNKYKNKETSQIK